jgi:hypothetical protein
LAKKSSKTDITLDELLDLRQKTESLSKLLQDQLAEYLGTLRPLLAPRRVLGRYAGAVGSIAREEEAFQELAKKYEEVRSKFQLGSGLEKDHLGAVDADLEIYRWEYTHQASGNGEPHPVTVSSPVRWVLTYHSDYTLEQMRQVLTEKAERRPHSVRSFVVHALAIDLILRRNKGIARILGDLRYDVSTGFSEEFGKLPLITLQAPLRSFLPSDKVVLSSTRFSGVPAFIELIDLDSIDQLEDPLRAKLNEIMGS